MIPHWEARAQVRAMMLSHSNFMALAAVNGSDDLNMFFRCVFCQTLFEPTWRSLRQFIFFLMRIHAFLLSRLQDSALANGASRSAAHLIQIRIGGRSRPSVNVTFAMIQYRGGMRYMETEV